MALNEASSFSKTEKNGSGKKLKIYFFFSFLKFGIFAFSFRIVCVVLLIVEKALNKFTSQMFSSIFFLILESVSLT